MLTLGVEVWLFRKQCTGKYVYSLETADFKAVSEEMGMASLEMLHLLSSSGFVSIKTFASENYDK